MTREEAERRADECNREHPDRASARWIARETADGWQVARLGLPPGMRLDPLTATVEAKPRPPQPDDPRSTVDRNLGGPWAAS